MSFFGPKRMTCTVCRDGFRMTAGDLVHPADLLCDACLLSIWDGAERSAWAPRIQPRMGIGADILADAIETRMGNLRELVRTRDEVESLLASRRG